MQTFRVWSVVTPVLVIVALTTGCTDWQNYHEVCLRQTIASEGAPAWVEGASITTDQVDGRLYLVGRSLAVNALDERAAYDQARDHCIEQLAKHIGTWVKTAGKQGDARWFGNGRFWLVHEEAGQHLASYSRQLAEALAGDLRDEGVYWEQWMVSETDCCTTPQESTEAGFVPECSANHVKRYKCWLRMSIDDALVQERVAATTAALARAGRGGYVTLGTSPTMATPPGEVAQRIDADGATQLLHRMRAMDCK